MAAMMVTSMEVEYDSDEEQQDLGNELNTWLTQLNQNVKQADPRGRMQNNGALLTQSHTMESFRCSVIMDLDEGGRGGDLDDIINDLCALEAELTDAQRDLHRQTPQTDGDSGNIEDMFPSPGASNSGTGHNAAQHPYSLQTKSVSQPQIHVVNIPTNKSLVANKRPGTLELKRQASVPIIKSEIIPLAKDDPAEHRAKEEKIRLAIQKIKAADIKKLFVKVFIQNGECKTILVDEKMTIHDVLLLLYEKCEVKPNVRWTIVEQIPDLYMERIVEDHEKLLSVMMNWLKISTNKVLFLETDDKYDLFFQPQKYLRGRDLADKCYEKEQKAMLDELFGGPGTHVPELEGEIYYKVDGQKTWKKMIAVLRGSGLYAKKGKSSKNLHNVVQFPQVEIYRGFGWKKKFRAPTEHCFAVKSPKVQRKSKEIRYFCCEDEYTLKKWLMGMRIAKYGNSLHSGFKKMLDIVSNKGKPSPASADTPSDSMSQSSRDSGFSVTSDSSNSLDTANGANRKPNKGGTMPPPPDEFSDLPPPPPELLREEPTPTNTPIHFVHQLSEDFSRMRSPGSSDGSSTASSISTPRNSVTSGGTTSNGTPTKQPILERHTSIRKSLRKGQLPTQPNYVAPPTIPPKHANAPEARKDTAIYEHPPPNPPSFPDANGHYGRNFQQHNGKSSSFSLGPQAPRQTDFIRQLNNAYASRNGTTSASETESDSDMEELPPPPPELLTDSYENPYDVPYNRSDEAFMPPPPIEYNPYADRKQYAPSQSESYSMSRVFACQTGTIKRAPPPPKRNDGTYLSADHR